MNRRILIVSIAVFLIALITLFPLRFALGGALSADSPLSARQVGGTIWGGRVGDAMLGPQRLGTFDVGLKPLPLLTGQQHARFERLGDADGPLEGVLLASRNALGVVDLTGQLGAARLLAPLPVESLIFEEVTARFSGGTCAEARGTLTAVPAGAIRALVPSLSGPVSCSDDGRLSATLSGGQAKLSVMINAQGEAETILDIAGLPPELVVPLASAGFMANGDGVRIVGGGNML